MISLDQQLHGYRNGHELLSTTVKLSRIDQELVDRLSDVAGPLRPSEKFEPYITCYPVPSATYYVVARTWQDLDAPRAGCVRTRSQLIPMEEWQRGVDLCSLIIELSKDGPVDPAIKRESLGSNRVLGPVSVNENIELVEAIFLEERKPIVVFDGKDIELTAIRLLTAFWPSFRQSFSLSTFALSPRLLGKRSFDLVFAPSDVRSRFSDWPGRRIDASKRTSSRHRWSQEIAERIFADERPSLLHEDTLGELTSETGGTEAELRISLLWNELYGKLHSSPNAVLGLLDIANSRTVRNVAAIRKIEPEIGVAARHASTMLPPSEAWRFLLALTAKLHDVRLRLSIAKSIRAAAIDLADRSPAEAIANVDMLSTVQDQNFLLGAIGEGLSLHFDGERAEAILRMSPANLLQILLLSPALAEESLGTYIGVISKVASALERASSQSFIEAKRRLLRLFVDDIHLDVIKPLIAELDRSELIAEIRHLGRVNGLAAHSFHGALAERAEANQMVSELRDVVADFGEDDGANSLLAKLIHPTREDLRWILSSKNIVSEHRLRLLRSLLDSATERQFRAMLAGPEVESVLGLLMRDPNSNLETIDRILDIDGIDVTTLIRITLSLLSCVDEKAAKILSLRALGVLLSNDMENGRLEALDVLLETAGSTFEGGWVYRIALQREVKSKLLSENLVALSRVSSETRGRLMSAIEDFSFALVSRGKIDLSNTAAAAMADLMWDSGIRNQAELVKASATLLPLLWRSPQRAASPLVAVAFPIVYKDFKNSSQGPDLFSLFFFADWDKCKTLRHEFLAAFINSEWRAADIALAAVRSEDADVIMRIIAQVDGGRVIMDEIRDDLDSIPKPWRSKVASVLKSMDEEDDEDRI